MTETSQWGPIQRMPRRRYVAAGLWALAQIVVACGGILLVYLTAMRMDGCASSCRDDVANMAIDGLRVALIVILVVHLALLVIALVKRRSPHVIGGVAIGLSLVAITVAYVLIVAAYPAPA